MNAADVMLQDVLARPGDDGVRLIYADWLDEHGGPNEQARAELIRLQIQLAHLPDDDEQRPELEAAERRVRKRHERGWLGPLREHVHGWQYTRGFVSHLALDVAELLRHHEMIARTHPVTSVRLTGTRERGLLEKLAALPFLERLDTIDVSNNYLDGRDLAALVGSPHVRRLAVLRCNDNAYGYDGINAIVESRELGGLRVLELRRNNLTDPAALRLADSPYLDYLSSLDLRGNPISEPARSQLRSLFRDAVRF